MLKNNIHFGLKIGSLLSKKNNGAQGFFDRKADCGCGCSGENESCNSFSKTKRDQRNLRLHLIIGGPAGNVPGISFGGDPDPQAPFCPENQNCPSVCTNDSHGSAGNCQSNSDGVNLMCANTTGIWCWTKNSGIGCAGIIDRPRAVSNVSTF